MTIASLLRGTGVIIAVLGLLDPAITLPWSERPRVAVRLADLSGAPDDEAGARLDAHEAVDARTAARQAATQAARTAVQPSTQPARAQAEAHALLQRVRDRFAREFTLVDAHDRSTAVDATIVVGPPESELPIDLKDAPDERGPLVAILPSAADTRASSAAPVVRITRIMAPRRAHLAGRVRLDVALDAHGWRGRRSTIAVRAEGLTLARVTHAWTRDEEQARVALDVTPIREGAARFSVVVTEAAANASADGASASRASGASGSTAANTASAEPAATATARATTAAETTAGSNDRAGIDANRDSAAASTSSAPTAAARAPHDAPALARADIGLHVTSVPLRVLFVEPRPSWTTRFIRLALATDPRFRVDAHSQVSRGLSARTADAPARLTASALAPFDAVIVGAPDQLGASEVEALRAFARLRGGLVVFAPDRLPQGAYVDLLPAKSFDEQLLEVPQLVSSASAGASTRQAATPGGEASSRSAGASAAAAASNRARIGGTTDPDGARGSILSAGNGANVSGADGAAAAEGVDVSGMPLLASELALPRELRAGAAVLARVALQAGAAPRPVVVSSPVGDGQVLFAGALDAWRFRDRPQPRFDDFWRQVVFALGAQAPPPVELTVDPSVARPGEPVTLRAVWRRDLVEALHGNGPTSVRATLARDGERAPAAAEAIRLWPADRPGEFRAALNAPAAAGVYAMSLSAESMTPVRTPLLVSPDVHRPVRSWEALRARVEAHGGLAVAEDRSDQAVNHLRQQWRQRPAAPAPRHPWRSAWWIVPFAGCLGGEWLLRRRRGEA